MGGGGGGMGGFGNLGMDSEYLNPVLLQRIEFLQRQISKYTKSPMSFDAPAEAAPAAE